MMKREEIQEKLLEPFDTLSVEERAEIEAFAEKDDGIRRALVQSRAFAGVLQKARVICEPGSGTWVRFLPDVRKRIESRKKRRPVWRRSPVLVPALGTALLAFILVVGRFSSEPSYDYAESEVTEAASSLTLLTDGPVLTADDFESLNQLGVDAASVAEVLDVSEIEVGNNGFIPDTELDATPLIDELAELPESDIDDLLAELKATRFI